MLQNYWNRKLIINSNTNCFGYEIAGFNTRKELVFDLCKSTIDISLDINTFNIVI